jgi:uncharacterized coiled-coil DUF342 family protein
MELVKKIETTRELLCQLSDEELKAKGATLAEKIQEREEILLKKKEANSEIKAELDECAKVIIECSNAINNGKEERVVDVEIELNVPNSGVKQITRKDTGEVWTEDMTPEELQENLNF